MGSNRGRLWWIIVALAAVVGLFGVTDILGGVMADPGIPQGLTGLTPKELESESAMGYRLIDFQVRTQGLALVGFGVLLTPILLIPYQAGRGGHGMRRGPCPPGHCRSSPSTSCSG